MDEAKKLLMKIKPYVMILLGSVITAIAINVFLIPYKIAPGGVSGIATVIYHISGGHLPVGVTMLALNIPLFIMGYKFVGRKFVLRTLFGTVMLSVIIDATSEVSLSFAHTYMSQLDSLGSHVDILLYSIFGGIFMGIGLGLVFRSGATTGGTDLAAKIVHHFMPRFTMGQLLLLIDTSVILFAAVAFRSFLLALYAIVTLYLSSKVIDAILEGVNFAKAVFIISDESDRIADKILHDLDRGVTALKGTGMYTRTDKQVLLCVVDRGQMPMLKQIVKEIDERAFIILTDIREVLGEGFQANG